MISPNGTQFYSFNNTLFFLSKKIYDLWNVFIITSGQYFFSSLREGMSRVKLLLKITSFFLSFLTLLTTFTVLIFVVPKQSSEKTLRDDRWIRAISCRCNSVVVLWRQKPEGRTEWECTFSLSLSCVFKQIYSVCTSGRVLTAEKATSYVCLIRKHST